MSEGGEGVQTGLGTRIEDAAIQRTLLINCYVKLYDGERTDVKAIGIGVWEKAFALMASPLNNIRGEYQSIIVIFSISTLRF